MENMALSQVEGVIRSTKKFQDDLQKLGLRIKQHEDNIKFLKTQKNSLDESILDLQVTLGKYHSSNGNMTDIEDFHNAQSEEETVEHILRHEKSAAGILCQLKTRHGTQASHIPLTKDVLGFVATLGKVDDDNLGRPYGGEFIADDPQRRLDILKPKLPGGEFPRGFLGYAVNMIHIDSPNLFCLTTNGHGLRETLFYHLFSHLQIYRTREDMQQALPFLSDEALSLDGGMIRSPGVVSLGNWEEVDVKFARNSGKSSLPENYYETENRLKDTKWKKERMLEDMRREQGLLDQAKFNSEIKKQEFVQFLAQNSQYVPVQHHQFPAERERDPELIFA